MGKTKTAFVGGLTNDKLSSEEKYKQKLAKRALEEKESSSVKNAEDKKAVKELGLKGGAKIKIVGVDVEDVSEDKKVDSAIKQEKETQSETAPIAEEAVSAKSTKEKKAHLRGKKYKNAKASVDITKLYTPSEAIKLVKSLSFAKFDETYELHIVVKKQGLNLNLTLPHSFGKTKRIEVANDKTVEKLKTGKIDFDVLLATAEMMPKLVMFAKLLGPRGLMPNPRNGTLIKSEKDAEKFSVDQKTIKTEKEQPVIHTSVGKLSMDEKDVAENVQTITDAITKAQIVKAYFKSTMSPSVKLQIN